MLSIDSAKLQNGHTLPVREALLSSIAGSVALMRPSVLSGEAIELEAIAKRAIKTEDFNCILLSKFRLKRIKNMLLCHVLSKSGIFYILSKKRTKTQEVSRTSISGCSGILTINNIA